MMQYPPQQPTDQPYYPPSEIYQYDQPQAYAQQQPIHTSQEQPSTASREIAIYYKRSYLKVYSRVCIACLILFIAMVPGSLILGFTTGGPFETSDIFPLTLTMVILLAAIIFFAWWSRKVISLLRPTSQPVLHITPEGISMRNTITVRDRFIPWNEIEAIYLRKTIMYTYLYINITRHRVSTSVFSAQPVVFPLLYLDMRSKELIQQLCQTFANELSRYNIQI